MNAFRPIRLSLAGAAFCVLAACATVPGGTGGGPAGAETVQILALNDFHGNLETPAAPVRYGLESLLREEVLGGAARIGATLESLREGEEHSTTVAAGDLIGASPLISALFLDEPTIMALNRMGLQLAAVGNHEFDRGVAELRRMQQGGCEVHTTREPCRIDRPFEGAAFSFLAANVLDDAGQTLFPGTAMRQFGDVRIGFIGMTLKGTATLVSPAGTVGYSFADEADTANALATRLRAEGADAVVLLIHQGGYVRGSYQEATCPELSGPILPILDRLDPQIRLVVSGHTHNAYVCELPTDDESTRLLTSAGRYGQFVTEIGMTVDPAADRILSLTARNRPVTGAAGEQADIATLVGRYAQAASPLSSRVVGRLEGSLARREGELGSPLGRLVADAQLAATRAPEKGAARIAFINSGGVRTAFDPAEDGSVTYGQIFALQPFGNSLVVLELTGAELTQLLEDQFGPESPAEIRQSALIPSTGFTYSYDPAQPPGKRIVSMMLDGEAIDPGASYRVAVNNFLASGGDGFSLLADHPPLADGGQDIDALEAHIAGGAALSAERRIVEANR